MNCSARLPDGEAYDELELDEELLIKEYHDDLRFRAEVYQSIVDEMSDDGEYENESCENVVEGSKIC